MSPFRNVRGIVLDLPLLNDESFKFSEIYVHVFWSRQHTYWQTSCRRGIRAQKMDFKHNFKLVCR